MYSIGMSSAQWQQEDESIENKKVDFGPRIKFSKPPPVAEPKEVLKSSNVADHSPSSRGSVVPVRRGSLDASTIDQVTSSLLMKLDIANSKIAELEKDRDEWRRRAESDDSSGNLGDMLVEIELETLRDEVERLRSLFNDGTKKNENSEIASLRIRCAELETQVSNLKREKAILEKKNKEDKNAEIHKIRTLQEQISNEKRLRERIANTESALPVVTVGGTQSGLVLESQQQLPSMLTIKPRSQSPAVPSFVVESAKRSPVIDPRTLDKTTVVLPAMKHPQVAPAIPTGYETLGSDALGDQWRKCLDERPAFYKNVVSRQTGTNIFQFGPHRIACKKIGNLTMIQLGRETMLLEKFLDTYGSTIEQPKTASGQSIASKPTISSSVTLKSIAASKNAIVNKQSSNN